MSQQIVILAAGKGTRMGAEVPKVLLPLANNQPIISHLLEQIKNIPQDPPPIIVVGFKEELVKQQLGSDYIYVTQQDQKGTGHAVLAAKDVIRAENFIVLYGDTPFTSEDSILKLIDLHNSNNAKISMFTGIVPDYEGEYQHFLAFGRIVRDKAGHILKIVEYKDATEDEREITEVNPGIYMFNSSWLWDKLAQVTDHNAQHEFYLTDIIELAIKDQQQIYSLPIAAEEIYGINTPEHLEFARKIISE